MREYIEVLNAELAKQMHSTNGAMHPPNIVAGLPNVPVHANNIIKYPPKAGMPQFGNQPNTALVAPQPS